MKVLVFCTVIASLAMISLSLYPHAQAHICYEERRILSKQEFMESALYYRYPSATSHNEEVQIVALENGHTRVTRGPYSITLFGDDVRPQKYGYGLWDERTLNRVSLRQVDYKDKNGDTGYGLIYFDACGNVVHELN